ncbi:hypothetical protein [Dictyobacter aurantiacus]|uniref:Uncharacterized protein n=1 Tax=Dictyobacter aurantiacus TaxID=1936993 RepID=A0A401ZK76_9CHLR|nr:hypothetical protein [Dictyobacter aurantiacus]GCE07232.1 hypothetical protein KDAU_45610 [Dictyobacter aurantiacus]
MEQAIYHMCPPQMVGEVLYPLNTLRQLYPDIYERERLKYQDHPSRMALPQQVIPKLNCLWNDVVQCSPIHPHLLYLALRERGLAVQPQRTFFRIPLLAVRGIPIVIVDASGPAATPLREDDVCLFDEASYRELDAVPQKALVWYDRLARRERRDGLFAGVPHIMVQGPISIAQARTICWGDSP